jgi:predicted Zn-dependent peptidase
VIARALIAALVLATPAGAASKLVKLADGSELLVEHRPSVKVASLRYVVRAGSARDPLGKDGLAHLLEHAVCLGSAENPGAALQSRVAEVGGYFNAFTTVDATTFVLDAPADDFLPLASQLISLLGSPELSPQRLDREKLVIDTEEILHSRSVYSYFGLIENELYGQTTRSILGSTSSRARVSRQDLITFFDENYGPSNVSMVFVGPFEETRVLELVEKAARLPPELPRPQREERVPPKLPFDRRTRAPFGFVAFGYQLDEKAAVYCRAFATVLDLRLSLELEVRNTTASSVQTGCMNLRGSDYVIAVVMSEALDSSNLPDVLRENFEKLGKKRIDSREQRVLKLGLPRRLELEGLEVSDQANLLAHSVARERSRLEASRAPVIPTPKELQAAAKEAFRPEQQLSISFSPFEG